MNNPISKEPKASCADAARLLQAASELVGGPARAAERFGMTEALLGKYLSGQYELPPQVLLWAVDIIEERESLLPPAHQFARDSSQQSDA